MGDPTEREANQFRAANAVINLLKAEVERQSDLTQALNELVSELTKHADTLRDALDQAIETIEGEGLGGRAIYGGVIDAYDEFMKEC